ncbi:MAG: hypothetical protein ABEK50_12765 [bacterium]
MTESNVTDEDRKRAEQEWQKIQDDPEYYEENYVGVTDEFLPANVDALLADLQLGSISREEFVKRYEQLSSSNKQLFLEHLPDCFPSEKKSA